MQTTFLNYLYSFKEEVIGKTTLELKLFTEQENIGLTILINQMKSSRTLKLTYKVKKEIRLDINIFAETEIDNEPCLLIVLDITERKKATEDLKKQTKR
jgi:hypothetical protein